MKYLLKQRISYKRKGPICFVYPNEFSSGFIKLARKKDLIFDENKHWDGDYCVVESYAILKNDYERLREEYKTIINQKRVKFYNQNLLVQLILLLKYIFNRNNNAKEVRKYSASLNAYDDKKEFLRLALDIAANIKYPFFKYGFKEDPAQAYHRIVYYFQIETKQVSFHNGILYDNCPEFQGQWIGCRNERFPFNLREIKKLI